MKPRCASRRCIAPNASEPSCSDEHDPNRALRAACGRRPGCEQDKVVIVLMNPPSLDRTVFMATCHARWQSLTHQRIAFASTLM